MASRRQEIVTQDTLKTVLSSLASCTGRDESASFQKFASLHQVQLRMKALKHIMIDQKVLIEYAVTELLTDAVQYHLEDARLTQGVAHHPSHKLTSRSQALEDVQRDAQSQSPYLIGWSLLYHLYIRSDLNISLNEYAAHSYLDVRTLRRYKKQVTNTLLKFIVHIEKVD